MKNILIIDDEPTSLQLLRKVVSDAGYSVTPSHNGKDALYKIELRRPDLIISDIRMPDMDGVDVFAYLRQNEDLKNIPVIIVTGSHKNLEEGFKKLGVAAFLTKPVNTDALLEQIANALQVSETGGEEEEIEIV